MRSCSRLSKLEQEKRKRGEERGQVLAVFRRYAPIESASRDRENSRGTLWPFYLGRLKISVFPPCL